MHLSEVGHALSRWPWLSNARNCILLHDPCMSMISNGFDIAMLLTSWPWWWNGHHLRQSSGDGSSDQSRRHRSTLRAALSSRSRHHPGSCQIAGTHRESRLPCSTLRATRQTRPRWCEHLRRRTSRESRTPRAPRSVSGQSGSSSLRSRRRLLQCGAMPWVMSMLPGIRLVGVWSWRDGGSCRLIGGRCSLIICGCCDHGSGAHEVCQRPIGEWRSR